ncbi:putative oxidoreductase [Sphingomonas jejuensis]|uniref:Oxidoreductase n=1 Tax=Sphingomonas jejuensis TaxID=904715 RepID=A0ABX0XIN7_9SPHN|nr:SDR family oxidoreductase [Sphingomonas jejuensis]NJC33194.1 putative oxidoreductase [Sphingomonas jejuensis]
MTPSGNTILITGGGSGIGRALAHRLHDAGNHIIIAGRRLDALHEAAEGRERIAVVELDIADPASIAALARRVVADHPALNILVNNAGVMRFEAVDAARDLGDAEEMITTNLLGPIRLTDALVGHLSGQPNAAIVNVTSGLAFVPRTDAPTYSATKAAIHSYTVSLRHRLAGRVEVVELAPPGVQTDLTPGQASRDGYQPLDEFADEVISLWSQPAEILVERVRPLRHAEASGQFDQVLDRVNPALN